MSKRQAYLTIDDSPTHQTDRMTDWLAERGIPAVFYCIGADYKDLDIACQGIESNPDPLIRAIEKGFVLGNHLYTHNRSSGMDFETVVAEIQKTESLIDGLYKKANKTRPCKLLRFPHLDRGCGGWIVDYNAVPAHRDTLMELFAGGLNIKLTPPTAQQIEMKARLQDWLKSEGFQASTECFKGVTFPWVEQTEMASAADALYTFSTSDWMLNPDFTAYAQKWNWQYQTLDALKKKIDDDVWLKDTNSRHVILAHDHNGLGNTTLALVQHFIDQGFEFLPVGSV